jgi:diacylglycerol kinase
VKQFRHPRRSWLQKFRHAFLGIWCGTRRQSSFRVHGAFIVLVTIAAAVLGARLTEWCLLLLCMTVVLTAEMFNSALERLAKAVDRHENSHLAVALDIGSGAVLMAALGASLVGALVFVSRLAICLGWGAG